METFIIEHLTEAALPSYIAKGTTLVDFYADWCQPCNRMAKILPKFAEEYVGRIQFVKVDVDELKTPKYLVKSIPTFHLYKDGVLVEKWEGIKTLLEMKRILDKHI